MSTNRNIYSWIAGIGCAVIALLVLTAALSVAAVIYFVPILATPQTVIDGETVEPVPRPEEFPPGDLRGAESPAALSPAMAQGETALESVILTRLYEALNPGVVNIRVLVEEDGSGRVGTGAGSGFVLDEEGHIVTNNHVVDQATEVIVVFYDGTEATARIVGKDDDSDLAVIQVDVLPAGFRPLSLVDSDQVEVGDWAVAIGNPFGLGSSMSLGIVSATGRSIPSGATPFTIPQAIQTDAAINPGNSGGPLLNLAGQVVGVNAQIRTSGAGVNSGVGFAIPSDVVRYVAGRLITQGFTEWPWLGVEGDSVTLSIMEANDLETQFGAYIAGVVPGGPAEEAGLRGTQDVTTLDGFIVPTGGDVVVEVNDAPIRNFDELLTQIAFRQPGEEVALTIVRNGERLVRTVVLEARPEGSGD